MSGVHIMSLSNRGLVLSNQEFDLAVVGAGIVGLAHAWAAAERGLRVVVLDRDPRAKGASVRNFGFITVTGQAAGDCWSKARRSRDVWARIAPQAGVPIEHKGLVVAARRPEAEGVIEAFLNTDMGCECRALTASQAREVVPALSEGVRAALWSPHELRVESATAIPRLAAWLQRRHGVVIHHGTAVHGVDPPHIFTQRGSVRAGAAVVCPGDDFESLFPDRLARHELTRCKLQMLRVDAAGHPPLGAGVMSDLGLARYRGYADLPEAEALANCLDAEQPAHRANGVHLIAVASVDGSLVVGDSHHYHESPDPFGNETVDDLILEELDAVLHMPGRRVVSRWIGTYASAPDRWLLVDAPSEDVRLVTVTVGAGASTAFAIAEETVADLFD